MTNRVHNHFEVSARGMTGTPATLSRPPFLDALRFSEADYRRARITGGLLELRVHVVSYCNLRCPYCFTDDLLYLPKRNEERAARHLRFEEICEIVLEAKAIGIRTVHILGPGEPLLYPQLDELVKFVRDAGLATYFPSNLISLTESRARFFLEYGVNIMGKYNSRRPRVQDALAGSRGAHARLERNLRMLVKLGFTQRNRLAAHTIVTNRNLGDIPEVFTYLRELGVVPFVDTLTMTGKATEALNVSEAQKRRLFASLATIDRQRFGYRWDPGDAPHIGDDYRRYLYLAVVNLMGDVYPNDTVRQVLGFNIREMPFENIVASDAFRAARHEEKHLRALPDSFWIQNLGYTHGGRGRPGSNAHTGVDNSWPESFNTAEPPGP